MHVEDGVALVRVCGIAWREINDDIAVARQEVRVKRGVIPELAGEGMGPRRLPATARRGLCRGLRGRLGEAHGCSRSAHHDPDDQTQQRATKCPATIHVCSLYERQLRTLR